MRQFMIRFAAMAAIALAASQSPISAAHACIKFDRAAEMALVNKAITSPKTPAETKTALIAARDDLRALQGKDSWRSEDVIQHHNLITKALGLIGKERIVYRGPSKLKVGAFKDRKMPKLAKAEQSDNALQPACG